MVSSIDVIIMLMSVGTQQRKQENIPRHCFLDVLYYSPKSDYREYA